PRDDGTPWRACGWAGIGAPAGRATVNREDHVSTLTQEAGRQAALEQIRVPDNVRPLNQAHVEALAGSIDLQGTLVPVVVRPDGEVFELVAGFHRIAAARSIGLAAVPVVVRAAETEDADRA